MEENNQNPSANLKVTANNTPASGKPKEPTVMAEMQENINDMMAEAAMNDPNMKPLLDKLRVAFKPLVAMAISKLGEDEIRYMVWRDPKSKSLILETVRMSNVKKDLEYYADPPSDDLFILPESTAESTENIDALIKGIFMKLMPKMY